jgi:acetyl-CoA carboxylase biotin carboxyl carrier protein
MASKFTIDSDAIRQLAEILTDTDLSEIEYEDNGRRVRVSRGGTMAAQVMPAPSMAYAPAPTAPAAASAATPAAAVEGPADISKHPGLVKSPMVGTAYTAPEPGASPFVKVGDMISEGQTIVIIEAMKVMNPIKAPRAGKVTQVFMRDATPVEFGEPLIIIE